MAMAHGAAARQRGLDPPDRRSSAEGRPGDAADAPRLLAGRAPPGGRRRALEPFGCGAAQLRHLPRAARGADREPALPRFRDAGQLRYDLLDRPQLDPPPAVPHAYRLRALDRADARHPALLP